MPTFQRCPKEVELLCQSILEKHESHRPLLDFQVKVDLLFAFADTDDETGEPLNDALSHHGMPALEIASVVSKKDRALGQGDALVRLDGDWWASHGDDEREALLDHELHHISLKTCKQVVQHDDLGRPQIKMRKHDMEVGWFKLVAERNGAASMERRQAALMFDTFGQSFWPQLCDSKSDTSITISSPGHASIEMTGKQFDQAAKTIARKAAQKSK